MKGSVLLLIKRGGMKGSVLLLIKRGGRKGGCYYLSKGEAWVVGGFVAPFP